MNIKKFWNKHKAELFIAGGTVIVSAGLYKLFSSTDTSTVASVANKIIPKKIKDVPESLRKFGITEYNDYGQAAEMLTDDYNRIRVEDLGKLGEALCDIPGITKDGLIWVLLNVNKDE